MPLLSSLTPNGGSRIPLVVPGATYSIAKAKRTLSRLVTIAERGQMIALTRRDVTVAYLVSRYRLEALVETLEILGNPRARKAIEGHRAGRTRFLPLAALKRGR